MILDAFRRRAPWQNSAYADMRHALVVEETLAHVRVVLFLASLLVAGLDPDASPWQAGHFILGVMAVYSLAAVFAVRRRRISSPRQVTAFHVVDTGGILLALVLTGGAASHFSTLFLFVLLAAGYRWGRMETWITAASGVVVLGAHALFMKLAPAAPPQDLSMITLRIAYAAIGGILIGYMAEAERRQRCNIWSVSRILGRVRAEAGLVAVVQSALDELMGQFRATHGVLVLEEEDSDRVALWQVERPGDGARRSTLRVNQAQLDRNATYSFPVPASAEAFKVRRPRFDSPLDAARVTAFDARGARVNDVIPVAPLFSTPFAWRTAFCVSAIGGEGWSGRLFLFLPFDPASARDQLRYFRDIVRQVAPAVFNIYLQRRLQSRAGVADRARISRDLHDGVIQALIGIEMQMEVLRRESAGKVPDAVAAQLANIQRLLGQEILDVRDLMHLLRPDEVGPTRLVEHLADAVNRFRSRTGIQARLVCDADQIDLAPRACREVSAIVREALANVRKHSGATSVVVRLERTGGSWKLVVDDNGCGLDFEGYLTPTEVDAQRKGPVIIKERARALGGSLALRSQPGFGTQLELTIPSKHHA
jgi:signal transduction histidine kinase